MKQITSIVELAALPHQHPVIVKQKSDSLLSDRQFVKWGKPEITTQKVRSDGIHLHEVGSQCGGYILTVALQNSRGENSFDQYEFFVNEPLLPVNGKPCGRGHV